VKYQKREGPTVSAPERFANWLTLNQHKDRLGHVYHYHPRSDAHSKALAEFIWADFLTVSPEMKEDFEARRITYSVNYRYVWPMSKKPKTIDLAVLTRRSSDGLVLISCELKTVMTEHLKSGPRIFDELSSSHEIVHSGDQEALALGVTVVNIASTFVSPLRQKEASPAPLEVTVHKQPHAAESMVNHLRRLPQREGAVGVGFDAYATFVVDCDNQGPATLWTEPPAPQPGDADHYDTFLRRVATAYTERVRKRV
jgi:hypothetical protein